MNNILKNRNAVHGPAPFQGNPLEYYFLNLWIDDISVASPTSHLNSKILEMKART